MSVVMGIISTPETRVGLPTFGRKASWLIYVSKYFETVADRRWLYYILIQAICKEISSMLANALWR